MTKKPPLFCSILTPRAASGIAVILVEGDGAGDVLARCFRRPSDRGLPPTGRAAYGTIERDGEAIDEVLVIGAGSHGAGRFARAVERFEVCCHGGTAAATAVIDHFASLGAPVLSWARLVEAGTLDEDLATALLGAEGGEQALCLAHLSSGPMERILRDLAAELERPFEGEEAARERARPFEELAATLDVGRFLGTPPLAVITGCPNAGKSTLFNAILGESRALTSPHPGTTRDPVEARFLLRGFPVRLVDTAGERGAESDPLARRGVEAAAGLLAAADLEIRLTPWPGSDAATAAHRPAGNGRDGRELLVLLSKCDLAPAGTRIRQSAARGLENDPLPLAALSGEGIAALLDRAAERLGLTRLAGRKGPLLWTGRQAALVRRAAVALLSGSDREEARREVLRYLGKGPMESVEN